MKEIGLIQENIGTFLEGVDMEEMVDRYESDTESTNLIASMILDAITDDKKDRLTDDEWRDLINAFIGDSYNLGTTSFLLLMAGYDFEKESEKK